MEDRKLVCKPDYEQAKAKGERYDPLIFLPLSEFNSLYHRRMILPHFIVSIYKLTPKKIKLSRVSYNTWDSNENYLLGMGKLFEYDVKNLFAAIS